MKDDSKDRWLPCLEAKGLPQAGLSRLDNLMQARATDSDRGAGYGLDRCAPGRVAVRTPGLILLTAGDEQDLRVLGVQDRLDGILGPHLTAVRLGLARPVVSMRPGRHRPDWTIEETQPQWVREHLSRAASSSSAPDSASM